MQARRGSVLWPCHLTHESFGIRYLKHLPNKGKWIIALKIGAPHYGRWFGEFNYMADGLAFKTLSEHTKACNKIITNRRPIHLVTKIILVRLWINIQCGIRDICIMAMSYPASNLHHFFSISINLNMPYKIKLIMSIATRCCKAQLGRWWYHTHLIWVLHIASKSMVDILKGFCWYCEVYHAHWRNI
jgi:hypothetical protein